MSVAELAGELEINDQHARRLLKAGKIPGYKIGGEYKVRITEFEQWLEGQRVKPPA